MKGIGSRLREERINLGFTVDEWAEKVGSHKNSIGNYELGKSPINVALLLVMKDFGADIGYIVSGVRQGGTLGFLENEVVSALGQMSQREKEAVLQLAMTLAGRTLDADELAKAKKP